MLNGQPEPKNLVRSVFSSIVTTPPQTFGTVTSNLPRVRQSELLTPAELMVLLLHDSEKIGLGSAKEGSILLGFDCGTNTNGCPAIGICFSMTDVFRSEILGVVMQQIVDERDIPILFMRAVSLVVSQRLLWLKVVPGHPSCPDVHLSCRIRRNNPPLASHYQENMDESCTVDGFHSLRKGHCACEFCCPLATPKRAIKRPCGEPAKFESGVKRVFVEERGGE